MIGFLAALAISTPLINQHEERSFLRWMRESNNFYTGDEYQLRFGIWLSNLRYVQSFNKAGNSFSIAMNCLAALTPAEYRALNGAPQYQARSNKVNPTHKRSSYPAELDFRKLGGVGEIKDMENCAAGWAFAAVAVQECRFALDQKKYTKLSEQLLIDCVDTCQGCTSGNYHDAIDYVFYKLNGNGMSADDYPYKEAQSECKYDAKKATGHFTATIYFHDVSEDDLVASLNDYNCVSANGIDASHTSFQLYSKGIYDENACDKTHITHYVNCVGYGTEGQTQYWIVRNAWGKSWGEEGYMRMIRGKSDQCGLASHHELIWA